MTTQDLVTNYTGSPLEVVAGRTTTLDVGGQVLRVISDPEGGNATVNPDGTVALVLPDNGSRGKISFQVEVSGPQGPEPLEVTLKAVGVSQNSSWGTGDVYMLETDAQDSVVVEPGENHRKVYVSGANDALGIDDIAAREGLKASKIDGDWLLDHPEYGATESKALDAEAGKMLWSRLTDAKGHDDVEPGSHWLMIEKGHTYSDLGRLISRAGQGESPLHPLYVGTWGSGTRPVIESEVQAYQGLSKNFVVQGLELANGAVALEGENLLLDGLVVKGNNLNIQNITRFTLRESQVLDVVREKPLSKDYWNAADNKISGAFIKNTDGLLIEDTIFDHNGWEDDYSPNGALSGGQPPSKFSHNLYIQMDVTDATLRDSVLMQGASFGAQVRSGGLIEGNLFAGNNAALLIGRSNVDTNNFSLLLDNLVSAAGYKESPRIGALAFGVIDEGASTALVDNIIAHLTDPSDTAAQEARDVVQPNTPLNNRYGAYYDDTIIYNWLTERHNWKRDKLDQNLPQSIAAANLDQVTLKNFVEDELGLKGGPDGVETLASWLRAKWDGLDGPADVIEYFQKGFGSWDAPRTGDTVLRFVPDSRGEGTRWDNPLNWSTDDLPGTVSGDAVDLAGNWVTYGGTTTLEGLDLGEEGVLTVSQGYLDVGSGLASDAGGQIVIDLAGQFWTQGYAGTQKITIDVLGGRFANTGVFQGPADLTVAGDAEALLVAGSGRFDVSSTLHIRDHAAHVGFDGQGGKAVLGFEPGATLRFTPDKLGFSQIGEFRSGHWGARAPDIDSTIDFGEGDTTLLLDLGQLGKEADGQILAAADTVTGGFGAIDVEGAKSAGLVLDYDTDTLTFRGEAGGIEIIGSDQAETFYVGTGLETTITGYNSSDTVDIGAVLGSGSIEARATGPTSTVLTQGDRTLVTVDHAENLSAIRIAASQGAELLPVGGSMNAPAERPEEGQGVDPEPAPNPAPAPAPAPAPDNMAPEMTDRFGEPVLDPGRWARIDLAESVSDPDGDALSYSLKGAPDFLSLSGRGKIVGLPQADDAGVYAFSIVASDGASSTELEVEVKVPGEAGADWSADDEVLLPVDNQKPEIVDSFDGRQTVDVGNRTWLEFQNFFSDPDGDPLTFRLIGAPDFAQINSAGRLVLDPGPDDLGGHSFWISASDGAVEDGRFLPVLLGVEDWM